MATKTIVFTLNGKALKKKNENKILGENVSTTKTTKAGNELP